MKHLIKDTELVAYLEGNLTKDEVRSLKKRLEENGELDLLYHLQLSNDEGLKEYANYLIGEDDFVIETTDKSSFHLSNEYRMAADKFFPKKEE